MLILIEVGFPVRADVGGCTGEVPSGFRPCIEDADHAGFTRGKESGARYREVDRCDGVEHGVCVLVRGVDRGAGDPVGGELRELGEEVAIILRAGFEDRVDRCGGGEVLESRERGGG